MNNPTVIFDPYAAADLRNIEQTIVDNRNIAITGRLNGIRSLSFSRTKMARYWVSVLLITPRAVAAVSTIGFDCPNRRRSALWFG